MKINILRVYCFATILLSVSYLSFGQNDNKIFVMVHFEAGRDTSHPLINKILFDELGYPPDSLRTNNLYFQQVFWLSTVHMIETADTFNVKLTLAIQSQMAEYILQDTNKINLFKNWIDNGHEFAMHHHGINHIDWGGYTNRFQETSYPDDYLWLDKFQNSGLYRGNMDLSFSYLQQLATKINNTIVTGCITDTQIDKPDGIKYLTAGGGQSDLISTPDTVPIPNETLYFLRHYQVVSVYKDVNNEIIVDDSINHQQSTQALNYVMSNINQIDDGEIMGIVYHEFDYYRFPDIYKNLFMFINQSAVNNQSIKCLMNNCNTSGIDKNIKINDINIFPNQTNGVLTIQGEEMKSIVINNKYLRTDCSTIF
ncbi:MAG: hypothetical protein PWQ06_1230 [Anaerophaga sp.]|nr:hypothetical protein [Anaerophaga sp.]